MDTESRISATDVKLFASLARRDEKVNDETLKELEKMIGLKIDAPQAQPTSQPTSQPSSQPLPPHVNEEGPEVQSPDMSPVPQDDIMDVEDHGHKDEDIASQGSRWQDTFQGAQYDEDDFADVDVDAENRNPKIRREKQEILFQLLKLYPNESQGQWSMRMPLFELKYELKRREDHQIEQEQIVFIKDILKMVFVGMEYANKKFGPILEIDGWADFVTRDMKKFDRCIVALYRRYFKRSKMDPLLEFFWLLIGSMVMYHIQCKYLGGPPSTPSSADLDPPPDTNGRYAFGSTKPKAGLNLGSLLGLFNRQ